MRLASGDNVWSRRQRIGIEVKKLSLALGFNEGEPWDRENLVLHYGVFLGGTTVSRAEGSRERVDDSKY
jgi:hypothetical protein